MHHCLLDLQRLTGGQLKLASMPPRDGELAVFQRIVFDASQVNAGDVFWLLDGQTSQLELAFLRGALGVVSRTTVEPWPGRFCLVVEDGLVALARWLDSLSTAGSQKLFPGEAELKVLQLCANRGADIHPPTCGQSARGSVPRRCRRRAA